MWLMLYSAGRFIVEIFRGDERGHFIGGVFSTSQGIAILTFAASAAVLYRFLRRSR
jgi:prolipoprotein diacylglyceryltransferase